MPDLDWSAIANAALTAGLLIFSGMQWWVTRSAERARRQERQADDAGLLREEARSQDVAFQTVWAEHFRLEALAEAWDSSDLVELSAFGVLRASDVSPTSWPTLITALGQLSVEAGYLGSVAFSLAQDAERAVARLDGIVKDFARQYPTYSAVQIQNLTRNNRNIGELEASIKKQVHEIANLFWDAARQSGRVDVQRTLEFSDDLVSGAAKAAVVALEKRAQPNTSGKL